MENPPSQSEKAPRKAGVPGPGALLSVYKDRPGSLPRERLAELGAKALTDQELLAVFLRVGRPGTNVIELAGKILDSCGGDLRRLSHQSLNELVKVPGLGRVHALELAAMFEFARRAVLRPKESRPLLDSPDKIARYLAGRVMLSTTETFFVLPLDKKMRLCGGVGTDAFAVSIGTADAAFVHPRDVFREAIRSDACYVALAHNHPSGDCRPSANDLRLTQALVDAGRTVGVAVADHVVLGAFPPGAESEENPTPAFHSMLRSGDLDFR